MTFETIIPLQTRFCNPVDQRNLIEIRIYILHKFLRTSMTIKYTEIVLCELVNRFLRHHKCNL